MISGGSFVTDVTYPVVSVTTGATFNSMMKADFGETTDIEDLWIPFFCVSTNVTLSRERVHTSGRLWAFVRLI